MRALSSQPAQILRPFVFCARRLTCSECDARSALRSRPVRRSDARVFRAPWRAPRLVPSCARRTRPACRGGGHAVSEDGAKRSCGRGGDLCPRGLRELLSPCDRFCGRTITSVHARDIIPRADSAPGRTQTDGCRIDAGHPHRSIAERCADGATERELRREPQISANARLCDHRARILLPGIS